jgi:ABC-type glutathione transport system ATPase component
VLRVRGLATRHALRGVDLDVWPGESLGLVGRSGAGKTTLARAAVGLLAPTAGSVEVLGDEITGWSARRLRPVRRRIAMVFQDPVGALNPRRTVVDIVAEPFAAQRIQPPDGREQAVRRLLTQVGVDPDVGHRYPGEFSGGQRQRIAIARALALNPELVICDEPVSAVDAVTRRAILDLLRDLQRRTGVAFLVISHDLAVVRYLCDRTAVLHDGVIVESGTTARICDEPRHPYTRALLAAAMSP